ncbi:Carboxypeptidase A4 [Hondaea fermentalgiana]|uniref:Carboxypeptidase A4 n=1 Tax=Hondaea fermentalgiana TaxID=2315210 RepID=A0A2R5GGM6_9STRA|nr:Carboxypeptidase A4 [Hondaea fermentalgiana]|eukprot:GBG30042.1 Carboxypeptidase A4 [Hondaea fermentalgiana]
MSPWWRPEAGVSPCHANRLRSRRGPRRRGRAVFATWTFTWVAVLLLAVLVLSAPELTAAKKAPRKETDLARAFGYTEREISKLKAGQVMPPGGCSDPKDSDFFARFRPYEEIEKFLRDRLCQLRREIGSVGSSCEVVEIGHSVEGRPILAIEIRNEEALAAAKASGKTKKKEKAALITGSLHAREWTSTTSVLLTIMRIDVTDVSVFAIPVINPDGYVYTWSGEKQIKKKWSKGAVVEDEVEARYWRKNRRVNPDMTLGVDLNRNFGSTSAIWGTDKKSKSINLTESDIYQGTGGFSEPETRALRDYHKKHKKRIVSFFDVHCCIGALLEPFSREGKAPDYVFKTGQVVIDAINTKAPPDAKYEWRPRPVSSASGSGISSSWAYQEARIPFTYVVELRGKFVERCSEIKPIANEILLGFRALLKELSRMESIMAPQPPKNEAALRVSPADSTDVELADVATTSQKPHQGSSTSHKAMFFLLGLICLAGGYFFKTKTEKLV